MTFLLFKRYPLNTRYSRCRYNVIRDSRGFTLVELMIVLFIIGLVSAIVVMSMPDPRGRLVDEAERFAGHVIAARDNAVLQSRPMALALDASGYRFEERSEGAWLPQSDGPFAFTKWRDGTVAEQMSGTDKRLIFDPVGLASSDMQVVLKRDSDDVVIRIDRNGTVRVGA